ncbi:DUF7096 domain-containing protein [Natranaeroarchaeum sulfidigenes]|uniref:Secreted protein, component of type IV pili likesystem n=1 Tax=Natranaeroarchaeum sulfidigenes TaxID=2784880 RepID=A0A897MTX1_9EURY|nr:hypothetical protein [Natranaeroarchaeum sulfidigenes]QSG03962.1 Secreted protein, component of type IV pili likesystem [Natranaeroarchaeum sulfidigenes]
MTRILATVFVALLVVTAPVTAAVGPTPTGGTASSLDSAEQETPDEISWVTTGADSTAETTTKGPDLGSALAMGDEQFENRIELGALEREFQNADSTEEKESLLDAYREEVGERTIALHEREAAITEEYRAGEIDSDTLLRDLAELSEEARTLSNTADTIEELSATDPRISVSVRNVRGELDRFDSPIRQEALDATYGDADRTEPILLSAAEERLVLSTLEDGTYVREGVQFDRFAPDEPGTFDGLTELDDRGPELYPWIYANLFEFGISGYDWLIGLSLDHPRGQSMSYIDATTQDVVMEYHTLDVESLPTTSTVSRTNENVTISSNRVTDGGPVWVEVTDPDSGDPMDASISVEGQHSVETDEDGTAWVLAPEGDVDVTATTDEGEVSITVRDPSS